MPSPAIRSSSSCCLNRDPPSPDGLAPRPGISASRSTRRNSKDHIPSWTTIDAEQLHAIFEEDSITAHSEASPQFKPKAKGKLAAILEGDKSDTDNELKSVDVKAKKSSSTLKAVTERLKKRLSRDSALSKRHSSSSVGTSEEEIERRAELRRIRERRIREELSNEGIYDDDAKSVSSIAGVHAPSDKSPRSWVPGDYIPLPALSTPQLPYPALPFPHLSPLDKAQDLLLDYKKSLEDRNQTPRALTLSDTLVNSTGSLSRRHSSPVLLTPSTGDLEPRLYFPSQKRSSLPPMPAAPHLEPTRLPSIVEPYKSSWRLSFASDHRGEHLRKLSQGHAVPIILNPEKLRDSGQPTRYIHTKGLGTSSQVVVASEDNAHLESLVSLSQTCSGSQDFGGVDGVGDGSIIIHLHEMGISQRLASRVHSASSPQLSSWGSHERGGSSNGGAFDVIRIERARNMQNTSDSVPLSERIPQSWGQVIQDSTSSIYLSAGDSPQPSRESSRFNLSSLLLGSRNKNKAEEFKETERSPVMDALIDVSTGNVSTTSLGPPLARYSCRSTIDDSSVIASETDSLRHMEAELSVVETRFASSGARRVLSTPVSSKFREEFDFKLPATKAASDIKPSPFSRLARLATRNYDGAHNMEELLNVPVPDFEPNTFRTSGSPLTPVDDQAAGIWGRALKKKEDGRATEVGDRLHIPRKRSSQVSRKKSLIEEEEDRPKGAFEGLINLRKGKKRADLNDHKSAAEEYKNLFDERVAVKEMVMDSWEAEMEASAARAKAKSRNIVKKGKPSGPDRRYPDSWSRFSSHYRNERVLSASAVDHVKVKDFARLGEKDGEIVWCLSHENGSHNTEIDYPTRKKNIGEKIRAKIEHELYRTDTAVQQSSLTQGRRGSLSVAGELEHPELEVLPLTLMTPIENCEAAQNEIQEGRNLITLRSDGNGDLETNEEEMNELRKSIADPKFYQDCLIDVVEDMDPDVLEKMLPKTISKKDKFRTWSGRDWERYKSQSRNRNMSLGSVFLRRSTEEYCSELEILEKVEQKRLLKAADDAWGRRE